MHPATASPTDLLSSDDHNLIFFSLSSSLALLLNISCAESLRVKVLFDFQILLTKGIWTPESVVIITV